MIIPLDEHDLKILNNRGLKEGEYPVESFIEGGTEFLFPSEKNDFKIRIFKQNGKYYAELPELEPANEGKYLDLLPGEYIEQPDKIWAIFV
jgi:hypothetical protein